MKKKRSLSISVFAMLSLSAGLLTFGFAFCSVFWGAGEAYLLTKLFDGNDKIEEFLKFLQIAHILDIAAGIVLVVSGAGLFKLKEWARKLSLIYGFYGVVSGIVNICYFYFYLVKPGTGKLMSATGDLSTIIVITGVVVIMIMVMIYPVSILVFMSRKTTKESFLSVQG